MRKRESKKQRELRLQSKLRKSIQYLEQQIKGETGINFDEEFDELQAQAINKYFVKLANVSEPTYSAHHRNLELRI